MQQQPVYGYRETLLLRFEQRQSLNPRYSLRAFARDLKIDASRLSAILKRKQGLSLLYAQKIASNLGLTREESREFCDQVQLEHARSKTERELAEKRLKTRLANNSKPSYSELSQETHRVISDWYYFAILELTHLKECKNDIAWIAEALGLKKSIAQSAVERLKRLKLLREEKGRLVDCFENLETTTDIPRASIRNYHHQILKKAQDALERQPVENRDFSNTVIPIAKKDLPQAKKMLQSFRRKFGSRLKTEGKDAVYTLELSFFELTENWRK